ncbi:hypothetical protein B0I21_11113 [Sphingobacterium paludis]|uniref:Uncharacterized protein n=1 Tax=Sphingobacterium paludis TaxID=1476465 RepID=A0A4R7CR80_9SPHI|nr:hypothetical protein B0I21_11113 [Sphingobacterium paludis]
MNVTPTFFQECFNLFLFYSELLYLGRFKILNVPNNY